MRATLYVLLGIIGIAGAQATESRIVLEKKEHLFTPDQKTCAIKDICELKGVVFRVEQMRSPAENSDDIEIYGTDIYASYETRSLEMLPKYAFAQFIRGCVYRSSLSTDGKVTTYFSVIRQYMGKGRYPFRHRDWSLDSVDADPIFASEPSAPEERHYFYEWLSPSTHWKPGFVGHFYGEQKPTFPQLYVSDNVPVAYIFDGVAQNVSFEFRMCLYKTADVPRNVGLHETNFASPIVCYDWGSSNVYDHAQKKFDHPKGVAGVCQRPFTPDEERRNRFMIKDASVQELRGPLPEMKQVDVE
jgi:hypothetical protein